MRDHMRKALKYIKSVYAGRRHRAYADGGAVYPGIQVHVHLGDREITDAVMRATNTGTRP
jgi:hypothetical protein